LLRARSPVSTEAHHAAFPRILKRTRGANRRLSAQRLITPRFPLLLLLLAEAHLGFMIVLGASADSGLGCGIVLSALAAGAALTLLFKDPFDEWSAKRPGVRRNRGLIARRCHSATPRDPLARFLKKPVGADGSRTTPLGNAEKPRSRQADVLPKGVPPHPLGASRSLAVATEAARMGLRTLTAARWSGRPTPVARSPLRGDDPARLGGLRPAMTEPAHRRSSHVPGRAILPVASVG
jgi:hypothetical protein